MAKIEQNYNRVNWQARKTPLSAVNLNRMDEGIDTNRKAIQELQTTLYGTHEQITYDVVDVVDTRFELPNVPIEGAYYYVSSTNSIYQVINSHYVLVDDTIKFINGGGAI